MADLIAQFTALRKQHDDLRMTKARLEGDLSRAKEEAKAAADQLRTYGATGTTPSAILESIKPIENQLIARLDAATLSTQAAIDEAARVLGIEAAQ